MERRLGRGLGSLLADARPEEPRAEIPLREIRPNPFQPRRTFDAGSLQELQRSIERHGILQPVLVRPAPEGYELISGERRWRAARLAGKETIPVVVRTGVSDESMLELALVENVQRRDLDPLEKARGYRQLQKTLDLTQEQVAAKVGLQRSTVTNHLRLLELPEPIQEAIAQGLLSMGHGRALLGLRDEAAQVALLEEAVKKDLSVREVERRVRQQEAPEEAAPASEAAQVPEPWVGEIEGRLRQSLGTKVRLANGPNYRGQIVIEYYDRAGLDGLLDRLAPRKTV